MREETYGRTRFDIGERATIIIINIWVVHEASPIKIG